MFQLAFEEGATATAKFMTYYPSILGEKCFFLGLICETAVVILRILHDDMISHDNGVV